MASQSKHKGDSVRRIGIIFSGGPAPAANSVIAAAAGSFYEDDREAIGFFHGYSNLQHYDAKTNPLVADEHYRVFTERDLSGLRNSRGIVIGTARANPGKPVQSADDLNNPDKTKLLHNVYRALIDLEIDALVSIGGDDTLKTANFLYRYQQQLPSDAKRIRVIHLPKTIDNDYHGIDFTFGFFTAVDVMAKEVQNLRADAIATNSYFIVETMGRKAGWLSYGVAIAGEANWVVGVEDVRGALAIEEKGSPRLNIDALVSAITEIILRREASGKSYGTIVLAEGLAELLPESFIEGLPRDEHGHLSLGKLDLGKLIAQRVGDAYQDKTGKSKKLNAVQLGYESRCAAPHAFDVMLGSQLGVGAYRALVEENLDGHMVSITGQLDLHYVPFDQLIDQTTMKAEVRFISPQSDFYHLARFLETRSERIPSWNSMPRRQAQ